MRDLLEAGVHFGHQTNHWNPKMRHYVFGARNGIYIIDLQKTVDRMKTAVEFVQKITGEGKKVLFVGTKKQAKDVVEAEAQRGGQYFVTNRWLGGMLTNYQTVRASIDRLKKIESMKANPEEWADRTKKEQSRLDKELEKLNKNLGGIQDMKKLPGALFVIDTMKEHIAIKEAKRMGIPVIAIVDTNCDPSGIDYVVPGNDDAVRSVTIFSKLIADACLEGAQTFKEKSRSADSEDDDFSEKKVSRFEGDIDLRGIDEADLAAMNEDETPAATTGTTEATEAKPAEGTK
jgi:small subunit ribosomal protein S2